MTAQNCGDIEPTLQVVIRSGNSDLLEIRPLGVQTGHYPNAYDHLDNGERNGNNPERSWNGSGRLDNWNGSEEFSRLAGKAVGRLIVSQTGWKTAGCRRILPGWKNTAPGMLEVKLTATRDPYPWGVGKSSQTVTCWQTAFRKSIWKPDLKATMRCSSSSRRAGIHDQLQPAQVTRPMKNLFVSE